jgi:CRP-like cAMP-binding protein
MFLRRTMCPADPATFLHACSGVKFRTSFMRNGALICDSGRVAEAYYQGEFKLDFAVAFPYVWALQPLFNATNLPTSARLSESAHPSPREDRRRTARHAAVRSTRNCNRGFFCVFAVPLSRLLRTVLRLYRVESSGSLMRASSVLRFNPGLVRMGQLMLMLFLACHWAGCLWWIIGEVDPDSQEADDEGTTQWAASTWLKRQPWGLQYAQSLLWGAGLMTTLMPFDVIPRTITETVVTIVVVICGLFINVFVISATTTALQNMDAKLSAGRQKVEMISKYLIFKKVPATLSAKIVDFYEYQNSIVEQSAQLADLPHELSMELNIELYQALIKNCPLFRLLDTAQVLRLLREMYVKVLMPSDIVVAEGQPSDALYFVSRGVVRAWKDFENKNDERQLLVSLEENDFFGENAILGNGVANATIECFSFCELLVISRRSFHRVLAAGEAKRVSGSARRGSVSTDNRTMVELLRAASVAVKASAASRKATAMKRCERRSTSVHRMCPRRSLKQRCSDLTERSSGALSAVPVGMPEDNRRTSKPDENTEGTRGSCCRSPDGSFANKRRSDALAAVPVGMAEMEAESFTHRRKSRPEETNSGRRSKGSLSGRQTSSESPSLSTSRSSTLRNSIGEKDPVPVGMADVDDATQRTSKGSISSDEEGFVPMYTKETKRPSFARFMRRVTDPQHTHCRPTPP